MLARYTGVWGVTSRTLGVYLLEYLATGALVKRGNHVVTAMQASKHVEGDFKRLKKLSERVTPYSIEGLASLYQDLGTTKVTEYGARVKKIYIKKLWIPEPGLLEQINMEFNRFELLSPVEQIKILKRLFGGY